MGNEPGAEDDEAYNKVFETYMDATGDDVDLTGLIAYALYKRQKRDWLVTYRREHGRPPTAPEIKALTGGYLTSDARRTYRDRAGDLLNGYAESYLEASSPALREAALNSEALRQAQGLHRAVVARTGFRSAVWAGLVATALWTFLVAILAAAVGPEFFRAVADALTIR